VKTTLVAALLALAPASTVLAQPAPPAAQPLEAKDAGAAAPLPPVRDVPVPSAAEAKKVTDYYFYGRDKGPLLIELKPCLKVDSGKDSPTKNDCVEAVSGPVKKGTTVHAWTLWLVPEGGSYDDVSIQYLFEGQVRSTMDVKLDKGGQRSRTWRSSGLTRSGKWEIKVMRGTRELGSATVTVPN
jgi:hypothetical protein